MIRDYSDSAVTLFEDKSIDFVFIDGSHDYTSVVKDINNYLPKVAPGGVIGGHDYNLRFFGVVNAVNDTLGYDNVSIRSDYTWFYFKKHE